MRGRPRIGEPIQLRLPDDLLAILTERAREEGVPRVALIRRILRDALLPAPKGSS